MQFWSLAQICKYLEVCRATLWHIRGSDPSFPLPIEIQGRPRFERAAIEKWAAAKTAANRKANAQRLGLISGGK